MSTNRDHAPTFLIPSELQFEQVMPGLEMATVLGDRTASAHGTYVRVQPGVNLPPHKYDAALSGVVVEGAVKHPIVGVPESERTLTVGSYFSFPADQVHATINVGEEAAVFFIFQDAPWVFAMAE